MRIGIYGGTFSPPHIGHIRSANAAAGELRLDLLIIVPAGIPLHKTLPVGTPPADIRYLMACLAFAGTQNVIVSDVEAGNPEPTYSIDTVLSIAREYPGADLFLMVGTDMYITLDSWKDSDILIEAVTPAVFSRGPADLKKIVSYSRSLMERYNIKTEIIQNDVVEISSSQLREMLPRRKGVRYINDTTYSYIIKERLYGAKPDWDWLRAKAYSMLSPERIPHVAGCEEESLRLAERWGVDPDDAREAAILHDITKKLSFDENIKVLEEHGVCVGTLEHAGEKLLHSKTGAMLARSVFGVSDGVADAIMWHTTGRAGMSALEKVIYLADYIEPERDFAGVGALRELAYSDIDDAMKMGLSMSIADMKERGIMPNRTTFDALSDLLSKGTMI